MDWPKLAGPKPRWPKMEIGQVRMAKTGLAKVGLFRSLLVSLGVFLLNFGGVCESGDPQLCTFGLSGCRVKPLRLWGAGASHDSLAWRAAGRTSWQTSPLWHLCRQQCAVFLHGCVPSRVCLARNGNLR